MRPALILTAALCALTTAAAGSYTAAALIALGLLRALDPIPFTTDTAEDPA